MDADALIEAPLAEDRLPTIREELARRNVRPVDAIDLADLGERSDSVRTWLQRNVWPRDELLKFARANELGDSLEMLAERFSFSLAGKAQDELLEIHRRRIDKPVAQLFREIKAGYVLDRRSRPPKQYCDLSQVVIFVQSHRFIAERDIGLVDELLELLVAQPVRICYVVRPEDPEEAAEFDLDPHVRRICRKFRTQADKRGASLEFLNRVYCARTHCSVSIADLITRVVLVAAAPGRDEFAERVWPHTTIVLQLHVGVDRRLGISRFRETGWQTVQDISNFETDFYEQYARDVIVPANLSDGRDVEALPLSDVKLPDL